jgi:cell wall-associated NlpC family hydrolase
MSHRSIGRCLIAATLATALLPAPAHGLTASVPSLPKIPGVTYTAPTKPALTVHPDTAPLIPGGIEGSIAPTQPAGSAATAPLPDGSGDDAEHAVEYTASGGLATRMLDGRNSIAFARFTDGDLVVVSDPSSVTGHSGLFDRRYYTGLSSFAVWSANVKPVNGVQREACEKYRAYDKAYGLWVPSEANHGTQVRDFAAKQVRKPYNILGSKTDLRTFYCSKLVWAAWRSVSGVDLDGDGGFWVWPIDLVNSRYTRCFGVWN